MDRMTLISNANQIREAILSVGGEFDTFSIGDPVPVDFFNGLSERYHVDFPADFVDIATNIAGSLDISWSLSKAKGDELNKKLSFLIGGDEIFGGELKWNAEQYYEEEIQRIYRNPYHNPGLIEKLHLFTVPNGDMVLFDLSSQSNQKPIIYFSHEEYKKNPPQLAPSFKDYVISLFAIGWVGSEIWQSAYFINEVSGGLDATLPASQEWRKAIGIEGMPLCF